MDQFADFVSALSHYSKPLTRDVSQFACMLFHPRIDGGIAFNGAVQAEQFRSYHR
jgi:hypothetical protein